MTTRVGIVVLILLVCVLLAGCAAGTEQGKFVRYDYTTNGTRPGIFGGTMPNTKATGTATIRLASGAQVTATCGIINLKPGDSVTVKVSDNGKWAVISKP